MSVADKRREALYSKASLLFFHAIKAAGLLVFLVILEALDILASLELLVLLVFLDLLEPSRIVCILCYFFLDSSAGVSSCSYLEC